MSDWLARAACRGKPISWWYPERGDRFEAQVAVMICRGCPVRGECLADAVDLEDDAAYVFGIRGAMMPAQRVLLRQLEHATGARLVREDSLTGAERG